MKVSSINVKISQKDLLNDLKEITEKYVEGDKIAFTDISIDNNLRVVGNVKQKVTISFDVLLSVTEVNNNVIKFKIEDVKIVKIGLLKSIKKLSLKIVTALLNELGVTGDDEYLLLDLNVLAQYIPYTDFEVKNIQLSDGNVDVSLDNISIREDKAGKEFAPKYSKKGVIENNVVKYDLSKTKEEDVIIVEEPRVTKMLSDTDNEVIIEAKRNTAFNAKRKYKLVERKYPSSIKTKQRNKEREMVYTFSEGDSGYAKVRRSILGQLKSNEDLGKLLLIAPDLLVLIHDLYKDKRISDKNKAIALSVMSYSAMPIDFIPSSIPFVGKIDDLMIILYGVNKIISDTDETIVMEHWNGDPEILIMIKEGLNTIVSKSSISKLNKIIEEKI